MGNKQQQEWPDVLEIGPECDERFLDHEKAPELANLGIQLCGISNLSGTYRVGRSNPLAHTLVYTVEGQITLHTPLGTEQVEKSQLITLPAGRPFLLELEGHSLSMAWFDLEDSDQWRALCLNRQPSDICESSRKVFHALGLIYYEKNKALRAPTLHYLERYLLETTKVQKLLPPEILRLKQLFRDVEKRLHYHWDIEEMCKLINYSAPHLHRLCQQHYKRSPLQQVIHMRISRAKHLLSATTWPVFHIAEQVGYKDAFSFSKRFKKSVGLSPQQYRKHDIETPA